MSLLHMFFYCGKAITIGHLLGFAANEGKVNSHLKHAYKTHTKAHHQHLQLYHNGYGSCQSQLEDASIHRLLCDVGLSRAIIIVYCTYSWEQPMAIQYICRRPQ